EHHRMVEEVTDLIFYFLRIRVLCCDHDLCRLFSYLFQDLVDSLLEQIVCIGAFLRMLSAVNDRIVDLIEYLKRILAVIIRTHDRCIEAGTISCMACRAYLLYFGKECILVTVRGNGFYIMGMYGSLAFSTLVLMTQPVICHSSCLGRMV